MSQEINNDELLDAMSALRGLQTPEIEQYFTETLINAKLLAPVNFSQAPVQNADGIYEIPEGAEMQLITFSTEDDKTVFPVFSSEANFKEDEIVSDEPIYPWVMTVQDYLPFLQNDADEQIAGLALDPFTNGMPITRDNLLYIGAVLNEIENPEVQVESAEYIVKTPLRYELIGIADDNTEAIRTMYLLRLTNGEDSAYLIVIDGPDRKAIENLYMTFEKAFKDYSGEEGAAFNIVMREDFGADLSDFTPIYTREL